MSKLKMVIMFVLMWGAILSGGYYAFITFQPDVLIWAKTQFTNETTALYSSYFITVMGGVISGLLAYKILTGGLKSLFNNDG